MLRPTTALFVSSLILAGCGATELELLDSAQVATLGFGGYDFSSGHATSIDETELLDGDLANHPAWPMRSARHAGGFDLWYRPSLNDAEHSYVVDLGKTSLVRAFEGEVDWAVPAGAEQPPLEIGHVYRTRCRDGEVAFEVLRLDGERWEATVRYLFEPGS